MKPFYSFLLLLLLGRSAVFSSSGRFERLVRPEKKKKRGNSWDGRLETRVILWSVGNQCRVLEVGA